MVLDLIQQVIFRNVIIFGTDLSISSIHVNNKTETVLVLGRGIIQEINGTTIVPYVFRSSFKRL